VSNSTLETIGVLAFDHLTLVVQDLERSRRFYVDVLGMRQVERPAFSFAGLWFQLGSNQIHLILEHDQSGPAGSPPPPGHASAGRTLHFAFEVADAHRALEQLQRLEVPIRSGPKLRPDGCTQIWCYDPDGHIVELFSRP